MKILNKFIWSKKEPSNKNDIWFDGSTWKMYTEEAWQSFTLPVDAADKVAKMLENASEVYQEKLNAGYGIIIDGNTISLDMSSIDTDTTHNIGSIELFDQLIKDKSRYDLHEDDIKAIQEGKLITTTQFGTKIPVLSVNHMIQSSTPTSIVGYILIFYVNAVLYNISIYDFEIVGGLSWKTRLDSLAPESYLSSNSYNAIQNATVTKKFEETDAKLTELSEKKEDKANKTTTLSSASTDTQYPSAKAVYDALQNVGGGSTPSGDPMHYMFETAGATYNAESGFWSYGQISTIDGKWYGLTDLTNADLRNAMLLNPSFSFITPVSGQWGKSALIARIAFSHTNSSSAISYGAAFNQNANIEFIKLSSGIALPSSLIFTFYGCAKLKTIVTQLRLENITAVSNVSYAFSNCNALENVWIFNTKVSLEFKESPNLSNASILYMIKNEAATSAITITLHASAYDRAMADAEITAALAAHPNVSLAKA